CGNLLETSSMRRGSKTLVLLLDGTKGARSVWRGPDSDRFTVAPWHRLPEKAIGAGRFDAVLYQIEESSRLPTRWKELRRLAHGLPLVPFRLEGRAGRRRAAAARAPREAESGVVPLTPPVDVRLLGALLERERLLADLRLRARRALLDARDAGARMQAHAAIVRLTGNELDPHRIIDVAMDRVRGFLNLRAWLFLLADPEQGLLPVEETAGEGMGAVKGKRFGVGEGIAGRAAQRRQPILVDDVDASAIGTADLPKPTPARSALAVPLLSRG